MMQPSNTPPDGDFVRYVEKLTRDNAAQALHLASTRKPAQQRLNSATSKPAATGRAQSPTAPVVLSAAVPPAEGVLPLLKAVPLLTHLKWLVVIAVAFRALGQIVPSLTYLFLPAMLAYLAWAFFKANQDSSGALFSRLRDALDAAADEARQARQSQSQSQKIQQLQQKKRQ